MSGELQSELARLSEGMAISNVHRRHADKQRRIADAVTLLASLSHDDFVAACEQIGRPVASNGRTW